MNDKHILVIEDEAEIRNLIEIVFRRQGFLVTSFSSVEDFKQAYSFNSVPDMSLMILDWMLPGQSGMDFLSELRRQALWKNLLVVMLTAKAEPQEVITGLEGGADDYVVKPFDAGVLLARVRALLRRDLVDTDVQSLQWQGLLLNVESLEAIYHGQKLPLTPTEFRLLHMMLKNYGRVFTREQLVQGVQGEGVNVIGRTIDTHIFSLRKKLGEMGDIIETARGVGYRLRSEETL